MALSVAAPIGYLAFLVISLWTFSKYYRKAQSKKAPSEPWFPQHKSRDIYISLLSLDPPPPRPLLVAALLRRAMDDVKLIWSVRDAKTSLTTLLQKGQIGDDLWERFLAAEKELEAEIVEVVGEANTFEPGYGGKIFNVASDMVSHERWKEIYRDIPKKREVEQAVLSNPTPSAVLAPTPYLTPSSLTLAPSNPLPAYGTSPAHLLAGLILAAAEAEIANPSNPAPAVAPLPQADAPPEAEPEAVQEKAQVVEEIKEKVPEVPAATEEVKKEEKASESPVASPLTSGASTPAVVGGSTPKKSNKKKGKKGGK